MTIQDVDKEFQKRVLKDMRLMEIRSRMRYGTATFADTAEYNDRASSILGSVLSGRMPSTPNGERAKLCEYLLRHLYTDTNEMCAAVQLTLDKALGIQLAPQKAPFPASRVQAISGSLEDQTVPMETIQRRAGSAATVGRSFHDAYIKTNAEFRDRAGLQSSAIREGGAKCCEWCASVSGKYPASDTPQGFWGRHDNCKCSILYETRKGVQRLGGSTKKWEPLEDAGAPEPVRFTAEQAAEREAQHPVIAFSPEQAAGIENIHALKGKKSKGFIPSVRIDAVYGEAPITEQFQRELSDEYDKFESIFGKINTVRSVTAFPYQNDGVWGAYNDNSGELFLFGAGGAYGREITARTAKAMRKEGKWSTASVYHSFRHELGHALQASMRKNDPDYKNKLEKIEAIRKTLLDNLTNLDESARIELMKKKLSVYGLSDDTDEFISECIAEFCNGNPRETAKTVVDILLFRKE